MEISECKFLYGYLREYPDVEVIYNVVDGLMYAGHEFYGKFSIVTANQIAVLTTYKQSK